MGICQVLQQGDCQSEFWSDAPGQVCTYTLKVIITTKHWLFDCITSALFVQYDLAWLYVH